ncbi:inactive protein RESTRICTED TEV MOVEMENT 2-like [Aristolochia californica]|uniref:inactive protein RESTRICTED TEV MOVEMENT 2-like n=1 Tax=Aristolochia californica TaxID=171875 RepID=UPI0035D96167
MGAACSRLFIYSYEDFQPPFDSFNDNGRDILYMHLPGFRKEELRVQLDDRDNLEVSGKRPVGENKWLRFGINFRVHGSYDLDDVRARFEGEVLYVIIPTGEAASPSSP